MTSFFVLHIEERYQPGEISPNTSVLPALILKKERKKKKNTISTPLGSKTNGEIVVLIACYSPSVYKFNYLWSVLLRSKICQCYNQRGWNGRTRKLMAPSTGFHTLTEQPKETPPFSLIFPDNGWKKEMLELRFSHTFFISISIIFFPSFHGLRVTCQKSSYHSWEL